MVDTNIYYEIENDNLQGVANLISEENKNEALLFASKYGTLDILDFILDYGADIHHDDDSALFNAVKARKIDNVILLLQKGANPSARNSRTLDYALTYENIHDREEVIDILLEYNTIVTKNIVISTLNKNIEKELSIKIIEKYRDLNSNNGELLRELARKGNYYQVDILLDSGANRGLLYALHDVSRILDIGAFDPGVGNGEYIAIESLLRSRLGLGDVEREEIFPEFEEDAVSEAEDEIENREERIAAAREQEEKNEERRRQAIEEYKSREVKEEVDSICSNSENLYGDSVDKSEAIVFLIEGKEKGECLTKDEIEGLITGTDGNNQIGLWEGPPSGVRLSNGVQPGHRMENLWVVKLPWSGIWVMKSVLEEALNKEESSIITLRGEKHSIGSSFGVSQLHGQWGGHWGYEIINGNQVAIYVESGNFQPDERYTIYESI